MRLAAWRRVAWALIEGAVFLFALGSLFVLLWLVAP